MEIPKFDLPLHPLPIRRSVLGEAEKGSEKFLKKIFRKDLVVSKKVFTFAPLSAVKNGGSEKRGATLGNKQESFFIAIYRTTFFEVFEQL